MSIVETVKGIILITLLLIVAQVKAQDETFIRRGLLKAQLTISPSHMFSDKQAYFYLHGNIEYYLSEKISLAGEGYYYLGSFTSSNSTFDYNHSLFFGASRHFINKNNDLYVGLQPGLSFTKLNEKENNLLLTHKAVNPLISTVAGYSFFFGKVFHFFIQTRLIAGEHNFDKHKELVEFRFSAGLGFNINTID